MQQVCTIYRTCTLMRCHSAGARSAAAETGPSRYGASIRGIACAPSCATAAATWRTREEHLICQLSAASNSMTLVVAGLLQRALDCTYLPERSVFDESLIRVSFTHEVSIDWYSSTTSVSAGHTLSYKGWIIITLELCHKSCQSHEGIKANMCPLLP